MALFGMFCRFINAQHRDLLHRKAFAGSSRRLSGTTAIHVRAFGCSELCCGAGRDFAGVPWCHCPVLSQSSEHSWPCDCADWYSVLIFAANAAHPSKASADVWLSSHIPSWGISAIVALDSSRGCQAVAIPGHNLKHFPVVITSDTLRFSADRNVENIRLGWQGFTGSHR